MSQPPPQLSKLTPLYSRDEIAARVGLMAYTLSQTHAGRAPLVIGVLKGAFLFVADLVRAMEIPVRIDFVDEWDKECADTVPYPSTGDRIMTGILRSVRAW